LVRLVVLGGKDSAPVAQALAESWDVAVIGDRPAHVRDLEAAVERVVSVSTEPNRTTVVTAAGEVDADDWAAQEPRPRLLGVRMAGRPALNPDAAELIARADAAIIGPDDADLVIDPILKVLGQSGVALPHPVIAVGHGHHRFEGFADHHVDALPGSPAAIVEAIDQLLQASEVPHG
jgi:hypothetical protein